MIELPEDINLGVPTERLSLRDYFAGRVLTGFLANPSLDLHPSKGQSTESALAESCYTLADAMIQEGQKPCRPSQDDNI